MKNTISSQLQGKREPGETPVISRLVKGGLAKRNPPGLLKPAEQANYGAFAPNPRLKPFFGMRLFLGSFFPFDTSGKHFYTPWN